MDVRVEWTRVVRWAHKHFDLNGAIVLIDEGKPGVFLEFNSNGTITTKKYLKFQEI
jgi:hypothetical protein